MRNAVIDLDTRVALLEANNQKIVKRGRRITAKTPITTETGFLRLDNIPVIAGGAYRIMTSNINLDSTGVNENMSARMRVVQAVGTGTFATTASTQIAAMRNTQDTTGGSNLIPMSAFYFAGTSGFLSIIITGIRTSSIGTMQFFASATEPFDLTVEFAGADSGDTGVIL
jgi:hypothetical protein